MGKIQIINKQLFVYLPKGRCEMAQLQKGDEVDISFNERGNLELCKVQR